MGRGIFPVFVLLVMLWPVPAALAGQADEGEAAEEAEALAMNFDTTPLVLDQVTITGSRQAVRELPGSAHFIGRERLEATGYSDPHRLLREIPGVYIQEEEGFGLFPNISIRGARSERARRITMMEDGILAAPAPYAAPAAYHMPTTLRMDRLEVRKGSSAIQHGPYTTGGAVNMVSTPVPEAATARGQFMLGEYGGRRHYAMAGDRGEHFGVMIEAVDAGSDGFKRIDGPRLRDPNMPEGDTGFDLRDVTGKVQWTPNADRRHLVEFKTGRVTRSARETYLGLTQEDFSADPFRRYAGSQLDEINTEHEQHSLRHRFNFDGGTLETTLYNNDFARNWYKLHEVWDGDGEPYFVGINAVVPNPEDHVGELAWLRGDGGDALGNVRANNREYQSRGVQTVLTTPFAYGGWSHELETGLRLHRDEEDRLQWQDSYRMEARTMLAVEPGSEPGAESGVPGSTTNRLTEADALAFHVQNRMRRGDWTLIPGLRYEDISIERTDFREGEDPSRDEVTGTREGNFSVLIPGFGATWQATPALNAFLGVHRGFAPTGASPDVDEERSINYEAGIRWDGNGARLELIGFHTAFENLVGTCTAASGAGCEVGDLFQAGRVNVTGLELQARHDLSHLFDTGTRLPVELAYTYTTSEFRESFESDFGEWGEVTRGDELPHIPRHQLNLGLGAGGDGWRLRLGANWVDESRASAGSGAIPANERIPSRWLADLSGEYQLSGGVRLFASVENLFDRSYLGARTPAGARPGQPRTAWAGLRLDF